jgi:hypothetical protein
MQSFSTDDTSRERSGFSLRLLAATAYNATFSIQPADSPLINYEAFELLFHVRRNIIDWLIEGLHGAYGDTEVWNAHVEQELDDLCCLIPLKEGYDATWLLHPVDEQQIAEQFGIGLSTIEEYVEAKQRTRPHQSITNGDILLMLAKTITDQVSYPGENGSLHCALRTDSGYQLYLAVRLQDPDFLASQDGDVRYIAHFYGLRERQVKQIRAFLALQANSKPTNQEVIASIEQVAGDWLALGLLPDTRELLSPEEAMHFGIHTPYIPCECGEPMYKGDGIFTFFGSYCSEECVHRYVCQSYALAGFVTEDDVFRPDHPVYRWTCRHI